MQRVEWKTCAGGGGGGGDLPMRSSRVASRLRQASHTQSREWGNETVLLRFSLSINRIEFNRIQSTSVSDSCHQSDGETRPQQKTTRQTALPTDEKQETRRRFKGGQEEEKICWSSKKRAQREKESHGWTCERLRRQEEKVRPNKQKEKRAQ